MLRRKQGATIAQIVEATGWQPHTVRGAFAGALKKKLGLTVTSEKVEGKDERIYQARLIPTPNQRERPKMTYTLNRTDGVALARRINNESNCAALAEMMWGAAVGYSDFVLFKIDRGVGGAIVSGGRVITGIAGGGGEFGHIVIDPNGELCRCGNRGCLELYASMRSPSPMRAGSSAGR